MKLDRHRVARIVAACPDHSGQHEQPLLLLLFDALICKGAARAAAAIGFSG
jgi:hypothetical protein